MLIRIEVNVEVDDDAAAIEAMEVVQELVDSMPLLRSADFHWLRVGDVPQLPRPF